VGLTPSPPVNQYKQSTNSTHSLSTKRNLPSSNPRQTAAARPL